MTLSKLLMVARWEFTEKIRTKAFLVALFLTPLLTVAFSIIPTLLATKENDEEKTFALYDGTGLLSKTVQETINSKYILKNGKPMYQLVPAVGTNLDKIISEYKLRVLSQEFVGIFIIPAGIKKDRKLTYYSPNVANVREIERIGNVIEKIIIEDELRKNNVDIAKYRAISKPLDTELIKVTKDGKTEESDFLKQFMGAYASLFLIIILITTTGQALVRSLLEEKNNRIMEVLLSSCSSRELMFGKLLGLGGLGLVQGGVWGLLAVIASSQIGSGLALTAHLPIILLYAILGYLFYASLMIGIGSTATTEQEAQNITGYIIMLSVMPFMFIMVLLENPNGTMAKVLSYIPFLTPSIMTFRISVQTPELWEILLSIVVMLVSIAGVIYLSSKIFTVGILSYGKRLTLAEVWHLLKAKS
ncbi:MAG: ABC transporter permease [Bacteroidetes bacterium]|nr:ABC transporter permease [Bacteroidota bacterium]